LALRSNSLKAYEGLRFDYCQVFRECVERVDVHFGFSCFEVDVAERLQRIGIIVWKLYEQSPVAAKAFEIDIALSVEVLAHFFDLEVCHVAKPAA